MANLVDTSVNGDLRVTGTMFGTQAGNYATCATAAATAAKAVTISGFTLTTGIHVFVKFTVTNTAAVASLTLNVSGTGAKAMKYRGGNLPAVGTLSASRVYEFIYDGTNWELVGDLDTNTQTVTGVKGNAESSYRTGQVNITPANIGVSATSTSVIVGDTTASIPQATTTQPKMDGTAAVGSETKWAKGDHVHPTDTSRAPASHTHGNIQNGGTLQTNDITIANGDKLVVTDSSDSSKVARTSVSFDGSTTTKALTQKGTFESFAKAGDITTAIQALDVSSVGGAGKYISAILETDGKISATATTMDTTPTASSTKAVTSGGIKTALDGKQPSRLVVTSDDNTAFSKISAAIAAGKDVWLNTNATYSGATYSHYVPLTEAVFHSGSYTAFIFSRSRAYSDENGIVDRWTCNSSSWTYETESVAYAVTAGTAATAGTANSASNANLGKTTDTTNGDLLYIGGGTQQRIKNAGHANSAKDYDQTGSIATALKSKQNLLYFTNTDGGTTSNPAADKKYVDSSIASWMLAVGTSYVKYRCNGEGIGSGNIGSIFWLSQIIYLAQDTVRIDIRGDFSSITKDNRFAIFPAYAYCGRNGSAEIRYKCKQYVRYLITLTNVGDHSATIRAISGGRATQSQAGYLRRGTLQIDGVIYETDTVSQPQNWDVGYFNWGAIGSIPAKSSRTWEMFWFGTEDTPGTAFSGRDYTYITTIK